MSEDLKARERDVASLLEQKRALEAEVSRAQRALSRGAVETASMAQGELTLQARFLCCFVFVHFVFCFVLILVIFIFFILTLFFFILFMLILFILFSFMLFVLFRPTCIGPENLI